MTMGTQMTLIKLIFTDFFFEHQRKSYKSRTNQDEIPHFATLYAE